jgi:hypothetical protein
MREQTASLYARYLGDLDRDATEAVIEGLIVNASAFPTIAEVRRAVVDSDLQLPTPLEAWRSATTKGAERHRLVIEIVELFGGTWTIQNATEPTIMRAQFLKAYGERRDEELRRANVARLHTAA